MFSKNPKLTVERMLVLGALGLYVAKHIRLKKQGELAGEPDLLVKVDKKKMFDLAQKHLNLNPAIRQTMEGLYETMMSEKDEDESST